MASGRRLWGFDDAGRALLLEATADLPKLQAVIARAQPRADVGLWLVQASGRELNELYDLVGAMMDATRSRRRQDVLHDLLGSLSTSIDGF